jgi:deoxyribodipyrimidine photo-lyase
VSIPASRVRAPSDLPLRDGEYVLYWMVAHRRAAWNHALDRALALCAARDRPLVVLEALRVGYRWASDRLHRFCIDGMADNAADFARAGVTYHAYVEPAPGHGRGLLEALAARAVAVVTDDFPCFFIPRMLEAAGAKLARLGVRLEAVDGNGLYPMRDTDRVFTRAYGFRRHLQKRLPRFFDDRPSAQPFADYRRPPHPLPAEVTRRWPAASAALLEGAPEPLAALPIDHAVPAVAERGGRRAARDRLAAFVAERYPRYGEGRNHPDDDVASGLSPYLHWGHLSAHEVFARVTEAEGWDPSRLAAEPTGSRSGWWGTSASGESFLDELITWRELGYNAAAHQPGFDRYASLPEWARKTLAEHADDPRPHLYSLEALDEARTHDPIWNAAQRQLRQSGRMHNYLRMLWGKKVLEWSPTPKEALARLIELNNRYALDGRNPNSYSGIFWVFGRYDRAWGPERPIFGKVRYMTSESTRKKLHLKRYLERWGPQPSLFREAAGTPEAY